jgi:hypothetical protein
MSSLVVVASRLAPISERAVNNRGTRLATDSQSAEKAVVSAMHRVVLAMAQLVESHRLLDRP